MKPENPENPGREKDILPDSELTSVDAPGLDRRAFIMRSAVVGAAAVIAGCSPSTPQQAQAPAAGTPPPAPAAPPLSPDLEVVKKSKGPVMTLVDEFYKVGPGPSSSHTIGPMRITYDFYQRATKLPADQLAQATALRVHLFGSLSATGKGHGTERAALAGLIATGLGTAIGVARLSRVWVVSTAARVYVEVMRNTPLLLQLLFWYSLSQSLPEPGAASSPLPGVFISFRGVHLPAITWNDGVLALDYPTLVGFGFTGGTSITPEFAALLIALSTSTAAFIAEIVRGGILAVGQGQREAAAALGLSRGKAFRLVVLPQALPVIIPPTTSQYLNVTKNSSLAVAIGYPDLVQVFTGTVLNQTGQAVEVVAITMLVYLVISLTTSMIMNLYNRRMALVER